MLLPILSGLVVSIDAFFIGLSLGLQKKCKFLHLVIINIFLFGLCIVGFLIAGWLYELIEFDVDLIVGFAFISLGFWCIMHYFVCEYMKRRKHSVEEEKASLKTTTLVGLVMSIEAMMITMGITFVFLPNSTLIIPAVVALAHFCYSALSFFLARTKYVKRIPTVVSHVVSGIALIIYGLMAIFVELGV